MAERLPSGNYRVTVYYTDEYGTRRRKSFTAATAAKAELLATNYNTYINRPKTAKMALKDYIESNEVVLSPSTIRSYWAGFRSYYTNIENNSLQNLTTLVLQRWMNELASRMSPKTCQNAWWLLNSALKAQGCQKFTINLPKKRKNNVKIPQNDEILLLLSESMDTDLYPCILLGAFCGLRRGEISPLTWNDINLANRTVNIAKSMVRGENEWTVKQPKTLSGYRIIDMPDMVYKYFSTLNSDKPIQLNPNVITEQFRKLCADNGMDYHFHLLRHYYASVCCAQGIPEAYTAMLMGHSTYDMVRNVYGHIMSEEEKKARQKIVGYFNSTHEITHETP